MLNAQPKRKPYRNKKILAAARDEPCLVNLPGCTGGGSDTVAAHSTAIDDGKGGAQKADDIFVAFACQHCHDILDGRKDGISLLSVMGEIGKEKQDIKINGQELRWYHDRGIKRTIRRLLDLGVIK